jgi:hypothetical protein
VFDAPRERVNFSLGTQFGASSRMRQVFVQPWDREGDLGLGRARRVDTAARRCTPRTAGPRGSPNLTATGEVQVVSFEDAEVDPRFVLELG